MRRRECRSLRTLRPGSRPAETDGRPFGGVAPGAAKTESVVLTRGDEVELPLLNGQTAAKAKAKAKAHPQRTHSWRTVPPRRVAVGDTETYFDASPPPPPSCGLCIENPGGSLWPLPLLLLRLLPLKCAEFDASVGEDTTTELMSRFPMGGGSRA